MSVNDGERFVHLRYQSFFVIALTAVGRQMQRMNPRKGLINTPAQNASFFHDAHAVIRVVLASS